MNIVSKMCESCPREPGTLASFGLPSDGKKRWCAGCGRGQAGAVNVAKKKCEDCGLKQPSFGLPGDVGKRGLKRRRWCSGCADGHEGSVDLASKMCEDCTVKVGLGRIVALHYRSSTSYQIHDNIRCLYV